MLSRKCLTLRFSLILLAAGLLAPADLLAATPTVTTLTVSPENIAQGTRITLSATVTANGTPLTRGLVLFCNAAAPYCTDVAILGQAQITASGVASTRMLLGPGPHSIKALFAGTSQAASSESTVSDVAGQGKNKTQTGFSVSTDQRTFTSQVTSFGSPAVTGPVSFLDVADPQNPFAVATPGAPTIVPSAYLPIPNNETANFFYPAATADFNGDGIPDLALPSTAFNDNERPEDVFVQIELGRGDGTFSAAPIIDLGVLQYSSYVVAQAYVADFNMDGIQDLFLQYDYNDCGVLLGKGDGTFTSGPSGPYPCELPLAIGDMSGDGIPDIVYSNSAGFTTGLQVSLGDGTGAFPSLAYVNNFGYGTTNDIKIADVNGDKVPDILWEIGNTIHVLLGKGDGTFTNGPITNLNLTTKGMVVADFNQDGNPDVGLADVGQIVYGLGDGNFSAPFPTNIELTPSAFAADIDGDGIPDWISSYGALYQGNGFGIFTLLDDIPTDKGVLAVADLTGNGLTDLIVGYDNYASGPDPKAQTILTAFQSTAVATDVMVPGSGRRHVYASTKGDATHIGSASPYSWSIYNIPIGTSTALTLTPPGPIATPQTVTLTATVTATSQPSPAIYGTMSFYDGNTLLYTSGSGSQLSYTYSPAPGPHQFQATFQGNPQFKPSASSTVPFTVAGLPTATKLIASSSTIAQGQPLTLFAYAIDTAHRLPTTGGTMSFYDGATLLASMSCDGGCTYPTGSSYVPSTGTHNYTAVYSGSSVYSPSTSTVVTVTVQ